MPRALLDDLAESIYNQRNEVQHEYNIKAWKCIACNEQFLENDLSDWSFDNGGSASITFTVTDIDGIKWATMADNDSTKAGNAAWYFPTKRTVAVGDYIEWVDYCTSGTEYHQYRIYAKSNHGYIFIKFQNGNLYNESASTTETIATGVYSANIPTKIRVEFADTTGKFDVYILENISFAIGETDICCTDHGGFMS